MNDTIKQQIEAKLNQTITRTQPLHGGMISQVVKLEFHNHVPLVAKYSNNSHDLTIEAYMLNYLKGNSQLPVPSVLHAEPNLLLMNYIDSTTGLNPNSQRHLGKLIATFHQIKGATYGHERDTVIATIHQPNPPTKSWVEFFREHRLLYIADVALKSGYLPQGLYTRLQTLADDLNNFLIEPDHPTLIHGDLWTTNILTYENRVVGIVDPALYYAHNEMELAFMTLFGTVSQGFFDSYSEIIPVDKEFFDTRRHIYNLYPLLVHVTLFGASYTSYLQSTLNRFGF